MQAVNMTVFCANCQAETVQLVTMHGNELIATCTCQRQLKLPPVASADLNAWLEEHRDANFGQVKHDEISAQAKAQADYLKSLVDSGIAQAPADPAPSA